MQPITPHRAAGTKNRDGIHTERTDEHLWPDPPLSPPGQGAAPLQFAASSLKYHSTKRWAYGSCSEYGPGTKKRELTPA